MFSSLSPDRPLGLSLSLTLSLWGLSSPDTALSARADASETESRARKPSLLFAHTLYNTYGTTEYGVVWWSLVEIVHGCDIRNATLIMRDAAMSFIVRRGPRSWPLAHGCGAGGGADTVGGASGSRQGSKTTSTLPRRRRSKPPHQRYQNVCSQRDDDERQHNKEARRYGSGWMVVDADVSVRAAGMKRHDVRLRGEHHDYIVGEIGCCNRRQAEASHGEENGRVRQAVLRERIQHVMERLGEADDAVQAEGDRLADAQS
mmetsp:Transcript_28248/g.93902  ORF Transcript_28248/g.93902 Transcript_28248/m.93902 type:complete len:260 (-) Transcript_28248:92-871(-)